MKLKKLILLAMLASFLTMSLTVIPVSPQEVYGPHMDYMHIKNYGAAEGQYAALDIGEIDFTDWYFTKPWIDKYATKPEEITLLGYSEIGSWQYDINNQRWPTGCDGLSPHTRQRPETGAGDGDPLSPGHDWDPDVQNWKVYFDADCPHCVSAWGFRLALAYLTDRPYIITDVLKGYGYPCETWMPMPAMAGWIDMGNLTESSFTYNGPNGDVFVPSLVFSFDVDMAEALLDAAGFTMITSGPDAGKRQDPRKPAGQALSRLIYYMRLDDPNREAAGLRQAADLEALGVPLDKRNVEKTVCFKSVMVEYNYHIYTGGYSLGADPTWLYGLFDSAEYYAPVGYSGGYQGFCNVEYDYWSDIIFSTGSTYEEVLEACKKATFLLNKYAASIDLWASAGVQGYRTGWEGVVNHEGYGPTVPITGGGYVWTLLNARWTGGTRPSGYEDTIWWGFKSNLEGPSVIAAEWVWDWQVLNEIYDTLIVRNPYNLAEDLGWMAEDWSKELTEWEPGKGYLTFTLREGMEWHDGTPVVPADIKFSLEFTRDCGAGVAWNQADAMDISHVDTQAEDPTLGPRDVRVYFNVMTYWASHKAGYLPMMNRKVWLAANEALDWGYVWPHEPGRFWDWDRLAVRQYHPWTDDVYNATSGGAGSDGIVDLKQDGSGPWKWVGGILMEYVDLEANRNFWLSQSEVEDIISDAFHAAGDVNRDARINIADISAIARSLGTDNTWPTGTGWGQYNPDADLNGDNQVNAMDLALVGKAYGKVAG